MLWQWKCWEFHENHERLNPLMHDFFSKKKIVSSSVWHPDKEKNTQKIPTSKLHSLGAYIEPSHMDRSCVKVQKYYKKFIHQFR